MSLLDIVVTVPKTIEFKKETSPTQLLTHYAICIGVGFLGGAIGVALTLALAIVIQSILSPTMLFFPGVVLTAIMAVLFGLGVSWLLAKVIHRIFLPKSDHLRTQGVKVILVFSTLASLLQAVIFMQGL